MHTHVRFMLLIAGLYLHALAPLKAAYAAPMLEDKTKAVILAYYRIGEDAYPETNIRLSQFIDHVSEIDSDDYTILPLKDILNALEYEENLPPKTLAITFDGAYKSAHLNAFPLLIERNIPFTVFYNSALIDQSLQGYMSWDELKVLAKNPLVTLGVSAPPHQTHENETATVKALNKARSLHRDKFKEEAAYLAYSYGEYTPALKKLTERQGFNAAFGLQSGPAYAGLDTFSLPRFSMSEDYGDIDRFRMITNTLPLPVTDIEPKPPTLPLELQQIGFTLSNSLENNISALSCFLSGYGEIDIQSVGTRIEIKTETPLVTKKLRLNCTLPENFNMTEEDASNSANTERWRWLGLLYSKTSELPITEPQNLQQDEPPELQE